MDDDTSILIILMSDIKTALNFAMIDKQHYKLLKSDYLWKLLCKRDYPDDIEVDGGFFNRYTFCYDLTELKIEFKLVKTITDIYKSSAIVTFNYIKKIPSGIGRLQNLQKLNISH